MGIYAVNIEQVKTLYKPAPNSELGTAVTELESVRSQLLINEETAAQVQAVISNLEAELANCKKTDSDHRFRLDRQLATVKAGLIELDRELGRLRMRERILNQKCLQETRLLRKVNKWQTI